MTEKDSWKFNQSFANENSMNRSHARGAKHFDAPRYNRIEDGLDHFETRRHSSLPENEIPGHWKEIEGLAKEEITRQNRLIR